MLYKEEFTLDPQLIELSILIPCLNEEENIPLILNDLNTMIQKYHLANIEIFVLDDSSADHTYTKAVELAKRYKDLNIQIVQRYEPRRGYGAIIRFGISIARGKFCVPVSADGVDPIDIIPVMLEKMRKGTSIVQCNRYVDPNDARTIPFKYKFFQSIWRFLIRFLLKENILDTTYSFKMFRRVDVLALGIFSNGFSISPEIFLKALLSQGKIEYIPRGQGTRALGESKFSFVREGFGYSYVLLRAWMHKIGILWF
jgi:glycosyltransferase involved in cell wall biosynthesis